MVPLLLERVTRSLLDSAGSASRMVGSSELKDEDPFADEIPKDGVDGGAIKWQAAQGPNGPTAGP